MDQTLLPLYSPPESFLCALFFCFTWHVLRFAQFLIPSSRMAWYEDEAMVLATSEFSKRSCSQMLRLRSLRIPSSVGYRKESGTVETGFRSCFSHQSHFWFPCAGEKPQTMCECSTVGDETLHVVGISPIPSVFLPPMDRHVVSPRPRVTGDTCMADHMFRRGHVRLFPLYLHSRLR